jgi:serine kinase of HPr protein (carbohydrate metabolism regulator)
MSAPALSSETIHCSCVSIRGRGVLIGGRPGSGKSDLALRLIDRGALLVSDDYTHVRRIDGRILASAPPTIKGKIEMRGVGIVELQTADEAPAALFVDLDRAPERIPAGEETRVVAGLPIPLVALAAHEDSAPLKVEAALRLYGLPE